jgi:YggT family protein
VNTFILTFDAGLAALRVILFAVAAVLAVVFAVDWAVRTRRISPFSGVARFFRSSVDPLLVPVERRIVRAGGMPTSAPWWALVAVVVGGIVLITVLGFVRDQIVTAMIAATRGARGVYQLLISWTFAILKIALLVRVVASWVRISPYSRWIRWSYALSEPMLRPLRQVIPTLGMIDITPIIAYILLNLLESFVLRLV